jgi:hypothetical protein
MGRGVLSFAGTSTSEACCIPVKSHRLAGRPFIPRETIVQRQVDRMDVHIADDRPVWNAHCLGQARRARAEREESQFRLPVFRLHLELGREGLLLGRGYKIIQGRQTLGRLADVRCRRSRPVHQDDQFRRNVGLFARLDGRDSRIRVDQNCFDGVVLVNYAGQVLVSVLGSRRASFGEFSFCAASPILSWCANSSAL